VVRPCGSLLVLVPNRLCFPSVQRCSTVSLSVMRLISRFLLASLLLFLVLQPHARAEDDQEGGFEDDASEDVSEGEEGEATMAAPEREAEKMAPLPRSDGTAPEGAHPEMGNMEHHEEEGVPEILASSEHGQFIRQNENALVLLTSPKCYLCRRTEREFARAVSLANRLSVPVKFGKVEIKSEEDEELLRRLNVGGLPVMFLNTGKGKNRDFIDDWWSAEALVSNVQQLLNQVPIVPVRALDDADEAPFWLFDRGNDQGSFQTTAVLFTPQLVVHNPAMFQVMEACRNAFEFSARAITHDSKIAFANKPRFAHVHSHEVTEMFGYPLDAPSIVVYKDFDEGKAVFKHSCQEDPAEVETFILAEATPRVVIVNHGNLKAHRSRGTNVAHVFVPEATLDDPRAFKPLLDKLGNVSRALEQEGVFDRGELMFFLSNGHQYWSWMGDYGLQKDVLPSVGVDIVDRFRRYALPKLSTSRTIAARTVDDTVPEPDAMPTPDPQTALLPEIPIHPDAVVDLDVDELIEGLRKIADRKVKASVVYKKPATVPSGFQPGKGQAAHRQANRKLNAAMDGATHDEVKDTRAKRAKSEEL
jgi:thioredoxin-related protein